jgi:hypothetical protein
MKPIKKETYGEDNHKQDKKSFLERLKKPPKKTADYQKQKTEFLFGNRVTALFFELLISLLHSPDIVLTNIPVCIYLVEKHNPFPLYLLHVHKRAVIHFKGNKCKIADFPSYNFT